MPKATNKYGMLNNLKDCYVKIPRYSGEAIVELNIVPDISDAKSANYNDEAITGRSFPLKTFSHSTNRTISVLFHFMATKPNEH